MKNFSQRLKSARIMKGYSLQDLADNLDTAVSKQVLNQYEQGLMKPGQEILFKLCHILDVRPDYFVRESNIGLRNIQFPKLKQLTPKESARIREKVIDILEQYFELEDLLGLHHTFVNPIDDIAINSYDDVGKAVSEIRSAWRCGECLSNNAIEFLENNNIKIIEIDSTEGFEGISTSEGIKVPVLIVNAKLPAGRKRLTLLYELGKLLMNLNHHPEKEREFYYHSFAAALLMAAKFNGDEKSIRFKQLIYRALAEEIISISKAAALDNKKVAEFRDEIVHNESLTNHIN